MKAVILAAGEGARMGPFTASVPKVMIPVGNRPLLESVVHALVENGVRDLVFVVGYRRERIQSHFQDGKSFHARITYVTQQKQLGTAHGVSEARPHLEGPFLVLNGSNMVDGRFVEDLLGSDGKPAVLITQSERPRAYGVVTVEGKNLVGITEKPTEVISNLINTGAYALDERICEEIARLARVGKHGLPSAVSALAQRTPVLALRTEGTWVDALYPWDLLRLNATALKAAPEVRSGTIEPAVTIRGRVSIGDGCVIRSGAYLQGPLSLGPGCEIGPNAVLLPSTSLGKNVRIGAHTSVANSILMDDVILGPASVVQDGVIGSGVVARAGLLAASGSADVQMEGEWHAVPQLGALIGEDVEIGNGVSAAPGTVINERARVESGARLRGTIPAGAGVLEMCGSVENYASLREGLEARGHTFVSQTDTESLVHLIESYYEGNLEDATRKALHEARGSYAILAIHADEPGKVVGARNESPLVVGVGPDENFLASDVPALLRHTDRVLYVMDKEMVVITPKGVSLTDLEGKAVARDPQRITWSLEDAEKGGFDHFMLKEIHEAPKAIHETLLGRLANLEVDGFLSEGVTSVKLVACGSSYHAALVGKYVFEELARIPASAELASEYRYSQGPSERPLVILISQSGETADTLGAAREARRRGSKTLGISNVVGSSLTREVDKTIYTRAGIEIGVAATKTFIAQLVALYLIALKLGQDRGALGYDELDRLKDQLRSLPRAAQYVLNKADEIRGLAKTYGNARDMFYIGRHANYPVALEGALKLKEISYIHAEGYAAGELKHGPLALVNPSTPVVAVAG